MIKDLFKSYFHFPKRQPGWPLLAITGGATVILSVLYLPLGLLGFASFIYLYIILLFISSHNCLRGIRPLYSSPSIHPTFCSEAPSAPSAPMSTCQQCKPCRQCTPCQQCQQFTARYYLHLWWYFYNDYHYHWDKLEEAWYVVAMCNRMLHF